MRILIYLEQSKIIEKMISQYQVNPGVGGTTFTAARLGIELHKESDENNLILKLHFLPTILQKIIFLILKL